MLHALALIILISGAVLPAAFANAPASESARLLVLHPVDLKSGKVSVKLGEEFRKIFSENKWNLIDLQRMSQKYQEYNLDIKKPCKELNCAFDVGNILQAQYSLYSTITIFKNYYIFSFNLVDLSITKVVWSENGEILIKATGNPDEALLHRLRQLVKKLKPANLSKNKTPSKGTLGILNLSPDTDYSKILFERLSTHAYTSGLYDLVAESELQFILESLEIKPSAIVPVEKELIPLGQNLGVDFLVFSKLQRHNDLFKLKLALYDIKNKKKLREWPFQSPDFRKLLKFEDKFFSNLTKQEVAKPPVVSSTGSFKWKWITSPAAFIAGGVLGYLAWTAHARGNDEYKKWQDSNNTLQELEARPGIEEDVRQARVARNLFGISGGLFIVGSVVLLRF